MEQNCLSAGHKPHVRKVHKDPRRKRRQMRRLQTREQQPRAIHREAQPGMEPQITASNKENPMSLGVLNNLSAVYAENNLNNTNNSLSKTLQQLSSGSKINSGADDAAGLSLVDGLQANQTALTQSETNATEGVGLLQVADGALSQVTSLLNRAVTLATEASNGTLNSSRTRPPTRSTSRSCRKSTTSVRRPPTTSRPVFDSNTNIYTGDSSTAGSVDRRSEHSHAVLVQHRRHRRRHGLQHRPEPTSLLISPRRKARPEPRRRSHRLSRQHHDG